MSLVKGAIRTLDSLRLTEAQNGALDDRFPSTLPRHVSLTGLEPREGKSTLFAALAAAIVKLVPGCTVTYYYSSSDGDYDPWCFRFTPAANWGIEKVSSYLGKQAYPDSFPRDHSYGFFWRSDDDHEGIKITFRRSSLETDGDGKERETGAYIDSYVRIRKMPDVRSFSLDVSEKDHFYLYDVPDDDNCAASPQKL